MRLFKRRLRRLTPEDRLLNGLLLITALALIVVGVWRMGSEERASSTEVLAKTTHETKAPNHPTTSSTAVPTVAGAVAVQTPGTAPTTVAPPRKSTSKHPAKKKAKASTTTTRKATAVAAAPAKAAASVSSPPSTTHTTKPRVTTTTTTAPPPTTTTTEAPTTTTTEAPTTTTTEAPPVDPGTTLGLGFGLGLLIR